MDSELEKSSSEKNWKKRILVFLFGDRCRVARFRRLVFRVFLCYLALIVLISLRQRSLIYRPVKSSSRLYAAESRLTPGTVHDIEFRTQDGLTLHGWHYLPRGETADSRDDCDQALKKSSWLVLYFHGSGSNRHLRQIDAAVFTRQGANVFIFDYRGYGDNPGSPSEANFLSDARTAWEYATKERNVSPDRIVIFGESLGGGIAVQLAADLCEEGTPPAGLFLVGTFSSLVDVAATHFPLVPVRWLIFDKYQSISRTKSITCPVAHIHGKLDEIVPFKFGKKLFDSFPQRSTHGVEKRLLALPQGGHSYLSNIASDDVQVFIERYFRSIGDKNRRLFETNYESSKQY